jgi:NhaP-type Na+/H+ or K+/H+ antiporter
MEVAVLVGHLWTIFEPLLFGLIGAEVSLEQIEPTTIGLGLAVLCIGVLARTIASFLVTFRLGLTLREKIFISLAWLPKATVQVCRELNYIFYLFIHMKTLYL